jgi:ketosteroid isomerase-like protein
MEDTMTSTESEVRALFDGQFAAIRAKDLDRLMSVYSADVVYYDVVPPLRYVGSAALRGRFTQWLDGYDGGIAFDVRDFEISASGNIAVAHWLSRAGGTLKNGREVGAWVRATSCCERADHGWLVTHEHVSLPVDMQSGRAVADLTP